MKADSCIQTSANRFKSQESAAVSAVLVTRRKTDNYMILEFRTASLLLLVISKMLVSEYLKILNERNCSALWKLRELGLRVTLRARTEDHIAILHLEAMTMDGATIAFHYT